MDSSRGPVRAPTAADMAALRPVYVVWEITLACNLRCVHCGSRAGAPRADELSTAECLSVIDQLHELGTREITLIGGEAYLRRDWLTLVRAIADRGILCGLQTGGRALTPRKIREARDAGLRSAGISIDGLREVHDRLRGMPGSYENALDTLRHFRAVGLSASVNTQINALNIGQLRELFAVIAEAGATGWQVQLTVPMGEAADRPELILQPYRLLELMPLLADLFVEGQRRGLRLLPGNNIGYFGPYEASWRSITGEPTAYAGCGTGRTGLGIEADGAVKGCPSLPTVPYTGGNIRAAPLRMIWERSPEIGFMRDGRGRNRLWGYCRTCYYANDCQAGCSWTAHVVSGRPGNNPFCHHRTLDLARQGLRESLRPARRAAGLPFDHGEFEIVLEDASGAPLPGEAADGTARSPEQEGRGLVPCRACAAFVRKGVPSCPFCDAEAPTDSESSAAAADLFDITASRLAVLDRAAGGLQRTIDRLAGRTPGEAPSSTAPALAGAREESRRAARETAPWP